MIPRSKYKDGDYNLAALEGYDVIQLKMDGNFCYCRSEDNVQDYFSDTDRHVMQTILPCPNGVYIGELMRGTQWSDRFKGQFFVFDMLPSVESASFRDRYSALRNRIGLIPEHWVVMQNYPMRQQPVLWENFVLNSGYEGLVYRRSKDPFGSPLIREKRTFTLDGRVIRFNAGEGKHEGRLGSLVVLVDSGAEVTIGSGWNDEERDYIYHNMDRYLGKWCEFTANAIFQSGNVRHARFVRWRTDKDDQ